MSDDSQPRSPGACGYPLLLKQLLVTPLANAPHREIVYRDRARHDYLTLRRRIGQLAAGLASLGVRAGDTVAVMDWDSHRYLECFFAIPMMGAVLHTVNTRLSPQQMLYTMRHAEDDVIIVHEDFLPLLDALRAELPPLKALVLIRETDNTPAAEPAPTVEYDALLDAAAPGFEFAEFDEGTRATTFYTTGTTGAPKGVHYSHRQLVLHTLAVMGGLGCAGGHARFHRDDVYMPLTPMFHVHAWGLPFVASLLGVKQVYPGRYTPEGVLALIASEQVTFSHCVPTVLHMLLSSPLAGQVDLSRWKIIVGGSALPRGLARRALELGIDVFTGYGMSETGPVLTLAQLDADALAAPAEGQLDLRCMAGRAIPMVDLRVVADDMSELPRDGRSLGEIVVRAPWLTEGYVKDAQGSAALWRNGYLHTGDIARADGAGYLQIADRLKDVIKSGGEWISSLALESIVSQHPAVAEVAAIGVPDEKWGERPLLLVVAAPSRSREVTPDVVRTLVAEAVQRGELPRWAIPERVLLVDAIDKTSVGKIDKKRLREKYGTPP